MSVSAKSIQVMVTDDYSYASLGFLIFALQVEKKLAYFAYEVGNRALSDASDRTFFVISYLSTYSAVL